MAPRKQPSLTIDIDEAFQRFYRQEKDPHVACEWFNQALREGLPLWCVDLRVQPHPGEFAEVPDYFALPPKERQPVEVKADYFASYFRVTIEQADGGWTAIMTTTARIAMAPADWFKWTVSAAGVNRLLKSELPSGRKRGRKPKFAYSDIDREITQRCIDKKTGQLKVPDNESKLVKAMLDWCAEKYDEFPGVTQMQAAVKRVCGTLRG